MSDPADHYQHLHHHVSNFQLCANFMYLMQIMNKIPTEIICVKRGSLTLSFHHKALTTTMWDNKASG